MQISQGAGTCSPFSMLWFIMKGNGIPGMAGRRVILFPANPASGMTHKSPLLRKPSRRLWLQRKGGGAAPPRPAGPAGPAAALPQHGLPVWSLEGCLVGEVALGHSTLLAWQYWGKLGHNNPAPTPCPPWCRGSPAAAAASGRRVAPPRQTGTRGAAARSTAAADSGDAAK